MNNTAPLYNDEFALTKVHIQQNLYFLEHGVKPTLEKLMLENNITKKEFEIVSKYNKLNKKKR